MPGTSESPRFLSCACLVQEVIQCLRKLAPDNISSISLIRLYLGDSLRAPPLSSIPVKARASASSKMSSAQHEPKITLFDIPSPICKSKAWTPNPWKVRFVLNYKKIPYKTVWVEYPDIEPTLLKHGGEGKATSTWPDDPSKPLYTLPAIIDHTNTSSQSGSETGLLIIDSTKIIEYLDANFPDTPRVIPRNGRAFEYMFEDYFKLTLRPYYLLPIVPFSYSILGEKSKVYFRKTKESWFGKKLEELNPEGAVRDAQWEALEKALDKLAGVLDKNTDSEWVAGGTEPTRADFYMASYLFWIRAVASEEWEKRGVNRWAGGRWARLLENTAQWQTVDV